MGDCPTLPSPAPRSNVRVRARGIIAATPGNATDTPPTQGSPLVTKERVMLHPTGTRVRLIDSVVRGRSRNGGPSAPEYVKRSWLRCLNEYGLNPDSGADPVVVSRQDLLARKEQNLEL